MDVFQLIGDFLHLIALLMLLLKILANKNVIGLSYKTQQMFLVVSLTRYSDVILGQRSSSLYFNTMRFLFIVISGYTIYVMKFKRPYKMVLFMEFRAMIVSQILSHIGRCIALRQFQHYFSIKLLQFLGFFGPFLFGSKLLQFYLNYI